MVKSKSDQVSVQHKNVGNRFYMQGEFYIALLEYNKALLYAKSKENLAFAYANRSACFIELKKYDECLQNIQWARENNFPADKIQKLNEREQKCKELKAQQVKDPFDDVRDFFKLSYPPNPKVPFIADCLHFGSTVKDGRRGIFTNQDLKPGDVVAVEEAVFSSPSENGTHYRCCNCSKAQNLNLIPCTKTATLMFCSESCRDEVYAKVENLDSMISANFKNDIHPERILREVEEAFGGRESLIDFIRRSNWKNLNCTVLDFDFSNPNDPNYKVNLIKCVLALGVKETPLFKWIQRNLQKLVKVEAGNDRMLEEFLMNLSLVCSTRSTVKVLSNLSYDVDEVMRKNENITEVNAISTHMNNRCRPNTCRLPTEDRWFFYIIRSIKAGEELFRNFYFPYDGKPEGKLKLDARGQNDDCKCDDCLNDRPELPCAPLQSIQLDEKLLNKALLETAALCDFTPQPKKSYAALIECTKANWILLASYDSKFPRPSKAHPLFEINADIVAYLLELTFLPGPRTKLAYRPFQ